MVLEDLDSVVLEDYIRRCVITLTHTQVTAQQMG